MSRTKTNPVCPRKPHNKTLIGELIVLLVIDPFVKKPLAGTGKKIDTRELIHFSENLINLYRVLENAKLVKEVIQVKT